MAPHNTLLGVVLVAFLAILGLSPTAAAIPFRHNSTALAALNGTSGTISNTAIYRQFKLPVSSSLSYGRLTLPSSLSVATKALDAAPESSSAESLSSITSLTSFSSDMSLNTPFASAGPSPTTKLGSNFSSPHTLGNARLGSATDNPEPALASNFTSSTGHPAPFRNSTFAYLNSTGPRALGGSVSGGKARYNTTVDSTATASLSWETRYRAPFQTPSNPTGFTNFGSSAPRLPLSNATFATPTGTRQHTPDTNSTAKLSLKTSHREPLWDFNWKLSKSTNHTITPAWNQSHVINPHVLDSCPGPLHSDTHKTELDSTLNARSLPYEPMDTGYSVNMTHLQWIYKPVDERHGDVFPVANSAERLHRRRLGHKKFDFDAETYFSFDIHYPKKIRPYNDFACDQDEPEIPDMEYYHFSEKHIADSQVFDWYASWTAEVQNDWTFEQFGEWGAFAYHFMKTQNFGCGVGMDTCKEGLTLYEIQKTYPQARNRPLVRRIYFVHMMYEQTHSYTRALMGAFQTAETHMISVVEEIVTHFTLQVDTAKDIQCKFIQEFVDGLKDQSINFCFKLFFTAIVPELTPIMNFYVTDPLQNKYEAWLHSDAQSKESAVHDYFEDKFADHPEGEENAKKSKERFSSLKKFLKNPKDTMLAPFKDVWSYRNGEIPEHIEAAGKKVAEAHRYALPPPPDLGPFLRYSKFHDREHRVAQAENERKEIEKIEKIQKDQREEIKGIKRIERWLERNPGKDLWEYLLKQSYWDYRKAYFKENPIPETPKYSITGNGTVWSFIWTQIEEEYSGSSASALARQTALGKSGNKFVSDFSGPDLPVLDGGYSSGGICAGWEGDFQNHNPENIKKLTSRVHTIFANTRSNAQEIFRAMYDGLKVKDGGPTVGARWLQSMPFTGNNSLTYFMDNMAEAERIVNTNAAKDIISSTLGSDFNFIKCGNVPDALRICADLKRLGSEQPWAKGVFCPRPDTEPTKICLASRWYLAQYKSHEMPMVAINTIEKFNDGAYGFTLEELLLESYESYREIGNKQSDAMDGQAFKALEEKKFHMPVCEYEDPKLMTVFKEGVPLDRGWVLWSNPQDYNWEFPAICGNHAGNETASFLEALGLGKKSEIHTHAENNHCKPDYLNEVFNDFIPRQLWRSDDPYTTYMGLCGADIRFPSNDRDNDCPGIDRRIRTGADKDCDLIRNGTLGMNIEQANRWFCLNEGGHTVFEREWHHVDLTYNPVMWWNNHKYRCSYVIFDIGWDGKPPPHTLTPVAEDPNKKAWDALQEEFDEVSKELDEEEENIEDGEEREEFEKIEKELDEEEQNLEDGEEGKEDGEEDGDEEDEDGDEDEEDLLKESF